MPAIPYVPNTPRWVDLGTSDLDASLAFYCGLFGWEADRMPMETAGGYTILEHDGRSVAGAGPLMMEAQPTAWTTYVYVDDLDATAGQVSLAGGTILVQPMDVLDVGRMAVFMDAEGAVFAGWQPGTNQGAELFDEPGSLCWNELASRDIEKSKRFYAEVFGWTAKTEPFGPTSYSEFYAGEAAVAGMREIGPADPPHVPPHWLAYFAVADCDATVARARELGATVSGEPMTIPAGRFAVLGDPQGAVFAVIAMARVAPAHE